MVESILAKLLKAMVSGLTDFLTEEQVKGLIDKAFDKVEHEVEDSSNQWDDWIVLPILAKLREVLKVPDND
jgi:hypothetical protein